MALQYAGEIEKATAGKFCAMATRWRAPRQPHFVGAFRALGTGL